MEKINFNELNVDPYYLGCGSFGYVYKCKFDGKTYAFKEFYDTDFLNGKVLKFNALEEIDSKFMVLPKFWIYKEKARIGYLTEFVDSHDLEFIMPEKKKIKYKILQEAKKNILTMHDLGIVHSDLSLSNILIKNKNTKFIDFDNANYKNWKTNIIYACDLAIDFMNYYGLTKEIDVFMFNILTYEIMNDFSNRYLVRREIANGNYGIFNDYDSQKICRGMLFNDSVANGEFLIDRINPKNL